MSFLIGTMLLKDGEKFDYPYKEAIRSMLQYCDAVYVTKFKSEDGTDEELYKLADCNNNLYMFICPESTN